MSEVKLRVFKISQQIPVTQQQISIVQALRERLNGTKVKERMMQRSSSDNENDLISFYIPDKNTLFGVMLRIVLDSTSPQISESLLESPNFSLDEMKDTYEPSTVYKKHYYFCLNDDYLVTNLPGNTTITGFQTYLNWLLDTATAPYEITPLCKSTQDLKLCDITEVIFENDFIIPTRMPFEGEQTKSKLIDLAYDLIRKLFSHVPDLHEEELSQVVSARLFLKFKKPKKKSEEKYQDIYGAIAKPVADRKNVKYKANGRTYTAEDIEVLKIVNIETTDKDFLVEEQLRQEMIVVLNEQEQS